jgi:hypothetical protein
LNPRNIYFLHNLPVTLRDHAGRTTILGQSRLAYERDAHAGCDFVAPLDFPDSKGCLFLKTRRDVDHIHGLEPARGGFLFFRPDVLRRHILQG